MSEKILTQTRISQFVSVGVVGATVETIIVAIFTSFQFLAPLSAKTIGAGVSISIMFFINDRWTFDNHGDTGTIALITRWIKSHMVRVVGLTVSFFVLYLLINIIEYSFQIFGAELWPTVANGIGIGAGMVINYIMESLFTWNINNTLVAEIVGKS
jgi:putative flippase GtrA